MQAPGAGPRAGHGCRSRGLLVTGLSPQGCGHGLPVAGLLVTGLAPQGRGHGLPLAGLPVTGHLPGLPVAGLFCPAPGPGGQDGTPVIRYADF